MLKKHQINTKITACTAAAVWYQVDETYGGYHYNIDSPLPIAGTNDTEIKINITVV